MPKVKPVFDDYKNMFDGLTYSVDMEHFNVNTKISITCSFGHTYASSVTKVKSLGQNPHVCPHCKRQSKYKDVGIPYETISKWANDNQFEVVNKKFFYKRCEDRLIVKCICHDYTKEILSLSHLEKNMHKTTIACPECESITKYSPVNIQSHLDSAIVKKSVYINLLKSVNYNTLPQSLRNKILKQDKWTLVNYKNTKTNCVYQCNNCGSMKETLPHNIFVGRGNGCKVCNSMVLHSNIHQKIKDICLENNIYPKNEFTYKDTETPIELKCNGCGCEFSKSWAEIIGCYYRVHCPDCFKNTKRKEETEFVEFIQSMGLVVDRNHKDLIPPYEVDVFVKDKNIAFEFCGNVWHSTKFKSNRSYHFNKFKMCADKGIKLVTVFEDEWIHKREMCENRIRSIVGMNSKKIYARHGEIVIIDNITSHEFFKNNHIQMSPSKLGICYGLKVKDEIVCAMSFAKRHGKLKNIDGQWELQRFCTKIGYNVCGGASKILQHFIKKNSPKEIVTFSDNRWGYTSFYEQIGFTVDAHLPIDYSYCGNETKWIRMHKFGYDKKKLISKCVKKGIVVEETDTETTLSEKLSLYRIYDCGHVRYKLKT